jgi:thioester reductase-like protein
VRLLVAGLSGQLGHGVVESAGDDVELIPLARSTPRRAAASRIASALGAGALAERTVEGDVTQPRWGLSDEALDELAPTIDGVLDLAGEVDWTAPDHRLFAANVLGAANGLECARALSSRGGGRCRLLCVASSVHVAGGRTGRVPEARLSPDPDRTRYETSKWQGEEVVLEQARGLPAVMVARIGGLLGNSASGATTKRNSLYLLADEWNRLPGGLMPRFGNGRVDMLPRDTAGAALLRAVRAALAAPEEAPDVVHICAGESAPRTDALLALARSLDGAGRLAPIRSVPVPGRALVWASQNAERFTSLSRQRGNALTGIRYLAIDRTFERDRLAALIGDDLPATSAEQTARLAFALPEAEPRPVGDPELARLSE